MLQERPRSPITRSEGTSNHLLSVNDFWWWQEIDPLKPKGQCMACNLTGLILLITGNIFEKYLKCKRPPNWPLKITTVYIHLWIFCAILRFGLERNTNKWKKTGEKTWKREHHIPGSPGSNGSLTLNIIKIVYNSKWIAGKLSRHSTLSWRAIQQPVQPPCPSPPLT